MRTLILAFMLTFSVTMTFLTGAVAEAPPAAVDGRSLALRKTLDLPIKGQVRIDRKAEISVSDNQAAVLVNSNGENIIIPLTPDVAQIQPIPIGGWNRPILVSAASLEQVQCFGSTFIGIFENLEKIL